MARSGCDHHRLPPYPLRMPRLLHATSKRWWSRLVDLDGDRLGVAAGIRVRFFFFFAIVLVQANVLTCPYVKTIFLQMVTVLVCENLHFYGHLAPSGWSTRMQELKFPICIKQCCSSELFCLFQTFCFRIQTHAHTQLTQLLRDQLIK